MAKRPVPKAQRNDRPINGCLGWSVALLLALGVVDSRRVMPSLAIIIAVYAIGIVATAVAWFKEFRWQTEFYAIGMSAIIYSIVVLILAGQFLLALGALAFVGPTIVIPALYRRNKQMKQHRRL